jgi:hypothetical protein
MNRHLTRDWLWQSPFWHRRRSLQAPASPGLLAALAYGSDSGLSVRRVLAVVKASGRREHETKRAIHTKAILGTTAGCSWTTPVVGSQGIGDRGE